MSYYKDSYSVNEIFLDFLGRKYIVKVGGTTPSIPFDSELKENDTIMWGDLRLVEYHEGGGGGTIEGLYSKDFNDVTAPQTVNIKVGTNFVQSPIEVLKEGTEQTNVQRNIETFDDGTDFNYNNDYVEFDGTAHLKTSYDINMSTPQIITDGTTTGYISESDNIDFDDYASIENMNTGTLSTDTVLCMPFNSNLNDLCGNVFTIVGNPVISNAQSIFGTSSLYLDGSSYFTMSTTSDFFFLGNDFTIEWWEYRTNIQQGNPVFICLKDITYDDHHGIVSGWIQAGKVNALASTNGSSWDVYGELGSMGTPVLNSWVHRAWVRKNNKLYTFENGIKITEINFTGTIANTEGVIYIFRGGSGYMFHGYINNLLVVNGEGLYDNNFIPSRIPFMFNNVIYLSGQEAYGIDANDTFSKLSNNWSSESDANKISILTDTEGQVPTVAQLETLTMPIKAVSYAEENEQPSCTILAIPEPQIITPKELIDVSSYRAVKNVSLDIQGSGAGVVKVAVTHDLSTYEIWQTNEWVQISDIATEGMTPTELSNIPQTAWTEDFNIVYYLETPTAEDNKKINTLTLTVDTYPPLVSQTLGTNYTYQYERPSILSVTFSQNGNYRVNYMRNTT